MAKRPRKSRVGRAIRAPIGIELRYYRDIRAIVWETDQDVRETVLNNLSGWVSDQEALTGVRADVWVDDLRVVFSGIVARMLSRITTTAPAAIQRAARSTSDYNQRNWRAQVVRQYGIDVLRSEPWLREQLAGFEDQNLDLITNMSRDRVARVQGLVQRSVLSGTRAETIREDVQGLLDVPVSRAKLISRDQVSKLNGDLTRVRQRNIGVEEYEWSTSQDERVRPMHRAKEGKRFRWDSPPADTGHPTEDIQCRCCAIAVFPDLEEMLREAGLEP